jgi:hypothetical protein
MYTDADLMFMCLDNLWDYLQFPMTLETFRIRLMAERRGRIASNWGQVADYLGLPGTFERWEHALVDPTEPEEVEAIRNNSPHSSSASIPACVCPNNSQ